jgi:hypothetical protein
MRTTLDLEEPVLEGLKSLQKKEKLPLGKIASRLLADALSRETAGESAPALLSPMPISRLSCNNMEGGASARRTWISGSLTFSK